MRLRLKDIKKDKKLTTYLLRRNRLKRNLKEKRIMEEQFKEIFASKEMFNLTINEVIRENEGEIKEAGIDHKDVWNTFNTPELEKAYADCVWNTASKVFDETQLKAMVEGYTLNKQFIEALNSANNDDLIGFLSLVAKKFSEMDFNDIEDEG